MSIKLLDTNNGQTTGKIGKLIHSKPLLSPEPMLSKRFFRFLRFFGYLNLVTLRKTFNRAMERRLMGLSAEMAYNAMLALFPAILAILTAIGLFEYSLQLTLYQHPPELSEVAQEQALKMMSEVGPAQALQPIQEFTEQIHLSTNSSLFSLSFIIAIWVSSGALSAAMNALDHIHHIPREQQRPFWKAKLISLGLTIGSMILLVIASFLVFISHWVLKAVVDTSGASILLTLWSLLTWPVALSMVAASFAFIYRYGPSRWQLGTPILPGAVLAAISWAVASGLFRHYVTANFSNYNKVYGTVTAIIILQLWLYMTSLVLLLGDQLNVIVGEAMQASHRRPRPRIKLAKAKKP
ncbi:MAG: YihY/virulence factor BrkB family protein [Moorea sp. SIO3C2]|nr:YihY/virulence factor BrkB family protein [Moorena sp. SIO3C2]